MKKIILRLITKIIQPLSFMYRFCMQHKKRSILIVLVIIAFLYYILHNTTDTSTQGTVEKSALEKTIHSVTSFMSMKNQQLQGIADVANKVYAQNKHYGMVGTQKRNSGCFVKGSFMTSPEATQALLLEKIDDVVCHYKVEKGVITAWSISLINGNDVYCGDSKGNNKKTPGITVSESCDEK